MNSDQPALPFDEVDDLPAATHARSAPSAPPLVRIGGRQLKPSPVFDTYWTFAAERQAIYTARVAGTPGPWTQDPILARHRFTCPFRAADRVSQYLIRHISYTGSQALDEIVFRTLLFKLFNRTSTWELLTSELGELTWAGFDRAAYNEVLTTAFRGGRRLYSAAYVIPPPQLGGPYKHTNHLLLLELIMRDLPDSIAAADDLQDVYETLLGYPSLGKFLAFQFAIDLNYSAALDYDENEFVVAGPGARDGIRKAFGPGADGIEAEVIAYMTDHQDEHFDRLRLPFTGLFGRKLHLIDCQNLFCETDKYARAAHPDIAGHSGRTRIKQSFTAQNTPVPAWFPPKWNLPATRSDEVPRHA